MYKNNNPMKNGTGCGCGCIKSLTQSNINSSNHIDPFKIKHKPIKKIKK